MTLLVALTSGAASPSVATPFPTRRPAPVHYVSDTMHRAAIPHGTVSRASTVSPLVLDSVTVIDVETGRRIPLQRVVIVGNRIQAMGSVTQIPLPAGACVVSAAGKYLIPGLWDMHVHAFRSTETFYPLLLANGITGIRDAGSPVPLDTLLLYRRQILADTRIGPPRQILSGPAVDTYPFSGPCDRATMRQHDRYDVCVGDAADARHVVDSLHAAGADILKLREIDPATYFVMAAEARRLHMPFGGHAAGEDNRNVVLGPNMTTQWGDEKIPRVNPLEASDSGASIVDHTVADNHWMGEGHCSIHVLHDPGHAGERESFAQCLAEAKQFVHNGTWFVPTSIVHGKMLERFKPLAEHFWAGTLPPGNWLHAVLHALPSDSTLVIAQRTGVPILAGTDVRPLGSREWIENVAGFSLHVELGLNVLNGLTPLNALQSATLNPARMWHATDSLGTVAPGKLADLVLLDADPLVDITNTTAIRAVVANGHYFDRAALDQILATIRATPDRGPTARRPRSNHNP